MIKTILLFLLFFTFIVFSQQINIFHNNDSASLFTASIDVAETTNDSPVYNFKKENSFNNIKNESVYDWKWKRDGIWTAASLSVCTAGLIISNSKNGISIVDQDKFLNTESLQVEIDKIDKINRWAAGYHSESARSLSDLVLYTSLTAPIALLLNENINNEGSHCYIYPKLSNVYCAIHTNC